MTHRTSAPHRLQKKIGSFICVLFLHSWSKRGWALRRLKEGNRASVAFLQRGRLACIKPSTNAPTAEQNFVAVTCPPPEITGDLRPVPLSKPATLPGQGAGEGKGPPSLATNARAAAKQLAEFPTGDSA